MARPPSALVWNGIIDAIWQIVLPLSMKEKAKNISCNRAVLVKTINAPTNRHLIA